MQSSVLQMVVVPVACAEGLSALGLHVHSMMSCARLLMDVWFAVGPVAPWIIALFFCLGAPLCDYANA